VRVYVDPADVMVFPADEARELGAITGEPTDVVGAAV
jgi:hypothetical protein